MALKGEAKREYNANYRAAQKDAKALSPLQTKSPRPSMPLVDAYPRLTPGQLKRIEDEFNVEDEVVADQIANIAYKHTFNYQAAAAEIAKGKSPADLATLAHYWRMHPAIQAAVQRKLAKVGLDDDAEARLVALLWNDIYHGSPREKAMAEKLLVLKLGWGARNSSDNKAPTELPIADLSKGLQNMGLGDDVMEQTPAAEFNAENLSIIEDEEDEEE